MVCIADKRGQAFKQGLDYSVLPRQGRWWREPLDGSCPQHTGSRRRRTLERLRRESRRPDRGGLLTHPPGIGFQSIVLNERQVGAERITHSPGPLLHYMRQFVTQQPAPIQRTGVVEPGREIQVRSMGKRQGTDRRRLGAGVDAHISEAGLKQALHLALDWRGQRLTGPNVETAHLR